MRKETNERMSVNGNHARKSASGFSRSVLSLAIAAALPSAVYAQTGQAEDQPRVLEEVVITGFRQSLQNSIDIKTNSSSIVEAISAEDIGKLPDTSIAESLARLPGLAGARVNGRSSGISVRGFGKEYVATTMNGRELLGIGDNRGVEYDLYPAEIISGAVVYKTPDATLVNQGLGGVIDLQTLRPLDNERIISINGSYEMNELESANPDFDDKGHRLAATYSDKFADDTFGLAVTVATMESPSQEEQFRGWGYPSIDGEDPNAPFILGGHDTFVRSAVMERDTISTILQFEPNDRLNVTVDGLYIDFTESKVFRGLEEGGPIWSGANYSITSVDNGLVTAGEFDGFHSVIRNDGEVKDAELTTVGLNARYQLSDDWSMTVDAATSESSKDLLNLESYSGVGRASTATQGDAAARSWVMTPEGAFYGPHSTLSTPDYTDPDVIRLAGPQAWGGGIAPAVGGNSNAQDGFVNNAVFEEELDTFRLSTEGFVDFSIINSIELGVNYSDRTKSKVNEGAFLVAPGYDDTLPADQQSDIAVPEEYIVGTVSLDTFGLGSMLAYDGVALYNDGIYREVAAEQYETGRLGDTYAVSEKVSLAYAMANFETGILSGNVGLQVVRTDQSASGYNTYTGSDGTVVAEAVTGGDEYTQLLPSLNMNFQVTDEQIVRFAAAKTISRARMDAMKPNNTIGFTFDAARRISGDPQFSPWSATSGTPGLKPIEAIQLDLSYEYYFADEGYVAGTFFYKDLQNWHITRDGLVTDFSDFVVAGYHDADLPAGETLTTQGLTSVIEEAGSGSVSGTELQGAFPFYVVSDSLDGLGIIASATFLDGEVTDEAGEELRIQGLSKESYQLTAYYERAGFEFRVAARKRSDFLTEGRGVSLSLVPTEDQGATLVDAQIGYDFSASGIRGLDGLTVRLQAQNLTNEETITADDADPRMITLYQNFGANYILSANYKF